MMKLDKVKASSLENQVVVGKVRDSHGLKGELFVVTNLTPPPSWIEELKEFTLLVQIPIENGKHEEQIKKFEVKKIRPHKTGFIVKADQIDDRNTSDSYKGAVFYIEKSYLDSQKGEGIYLQEVKGFMLFDKEIKIGIISGFSTNNAQDLLQTEYQGHSVSIPFVQQYVIKIDWENKKIILDLPEGLLESQIS